MAEWLVRWRKRNGVKVDRVNGNRICECVCMSSSTCVVGFVCRRGENGRMSVNVRVSSRTTLDDDGLYSCRGGAKTPSNHLPVTHATYCNEIPFIKFSSWKPRARMSHISSRRALRLRIDRVKILRSRENHVSVNFVWLKKFHIYIVLNRKYY